MIGGYVKWILHKVIEGGQKVNCIYCHKAKGMCEYKAEEDLNERC
jgi:hypothetical protein